MCDSDEEADLTGLADAVSSDDEEVEKDQDELERLTGRGRFAAELELWVLENDSEAIIPCCDDGDSDGAAEAASALAKLVAKGQFSEVVSGDVAKHLVAISSIEAEPVGGGARNPAARRERLLDALQQRAISYVARGIIGGGSAADGTGTGADGGGEGSRELRAATLLLAGIASFNLFLQVNYTGPMIEPAAMLAAELLHVRALFGDDDEASHAYALSLLEVEGELPSRLAKLPALLVLARIWLRAAAGSGSNWARSCTVATVRAAEARAGEGGTATASASAPASSPSSEVVGTAAFTAAWWCSRAVVAHERLLVAAKSVPETLWAEAALLFDVALARFGRSGRARAGGSGGGTAGASHVKRERVDANANGKVKVKGGFRSAQIWLEWGLAESHFDRPSKGRESFASAQKASGLVAELVGAMGKRTKFQQRSLAQMVVMARSVSVPAPPPSGGAPAAPEAVKPPPPPPAAAASSSSAAASDDARGDAAAPPSEAAELGELGGVPVRAAQHPSDGILYETTQFDAGTGAVGDEQPNLHPLDQAILLAQCLDVANSNPKDGLTSEQMMPYLQRVLQHPNNWMIYSTSLLQRAHLEAESAHSCDRAILQIQALVDQHTSRLTLTQSTVESVEAAAPVEERLRYLHAIVYPPQWEIKRDLAYSYAKIGVFLSAAAMFEELGLWDEVVNCFKLSGKHNKAQALVEKRLELDGPTPEMLAALGDLTDDPVHWTKAWELSHARYARAKRSLGQWAFKNGKLEEAAAHFEAAVAVKPLAAECWFSLGSACMRLNRWEDALAAFSRVVQQDPEQNDAWGNIAAIHMKLKNAASAYAALKEALRGAHENWRAWENLLTVTIELAKFSEAIYTMGQLLSLRSKSARPTNIVALRVLILGVLRSAGKAPVGAEPVDEASGGGPAAAVDPTAARLLTQMSELLARLTATLASSAQLWDCAAVFHRATGKRALTVECRMKQSRALQAHASWEKEPEHVAALVAALSSLVEVHLEGPSTSDGAGAEVEDATARKKALYTCRMTVASVRAKLEAHLNALPATAAAAAQDAAMREAPQQLAQLLVDIDGAIEHAEETATATPSVALPSAVTKTEL